MIRWNYFFVFFIVFATAACGGSSAEEAVTVVLASEIDGATIQTSDGVVIDMPQGAVSEDVEVRVTASDLVIPGLETTGRVVSIEPASTRLLKPSQLIMPYDEDSGSEDQLSIYRADSRQANRDSWVPVPSAVNTSRKRVATEIRKFGHFVVARRPLTQRSADSSDTAIDMTPLTGEAVARVGNLGASLGLMDGAFLQIPEGALATNTVVGFMVFHSQVQGVQPVSEVYAISPTDTVLQAPATVSLPLFQSVDVDDALVVLRSDSLQSPGDDWQVLQVQSRQDTHTAAASTHQFGFFVVAVAEPGSGTADSETDSGTAAGEDSGTGPEVRGTDGLDTGTDLDTGQGAFSDSDVTTDIGTDIGSDHVTTNPLDTDTDSSSDGDADTALGAHIDTAYIDTEDTASEMPFDTETDEETEQVPDSSLDTDSAADTASDIQPDTGIVDTSSDIPLRACDDDPCVRGICENVADGFHCDCPMGYDGDTCADCATGYQDNDANGSCQPDCATAELDCVPRSTCNDSSGTAACVCDDGYTGANCDACASGYYDDDDDNFQCVVIPDGCDGAIVFGHADVEAEVRDAAGVTEGDLFFEDVRQITELELPVKYRQTIETIEGVQCLVGLISFKAYQQGISDITPLRALRHLSYLDLTSNRIASAEPLSGLTALQYLAMSQNALVTASDLSELVNLVELHLSNNGITDLSALAAMTQLQELRIAGNGIDDLAGVENLGSLTLLDVQANSITDISPLAELGNLTSVLVGENDIADISWLNGLAGLENLSAPDNVIDTIGSFTQLTGLRVLNLSGNQIDDISELSALSDATGLIGLFLDRNLLSDEDLSALYGLHGLQNLYLSNNLFNCDNPQVIADLNTLALLTAETVHHDCQ